MKNAREQADVILYLVNAAEDPAAASYVALEMDVLAWIGKPVVVLLNQMGPPREDVSGEIARWSEIGGQGLVRAVLPLDAFARCWVQEIALLETVAALLPPEKATAMIGLGHRWEELNRARFAASMEVLARYLQRAARDLEAVDEQSWQGKVAGALSGKSAGDRAAHKAMGLLTARLSEATARSTDELIRLHNLSGKVAHQVLERVSGDYAQQLKAPKGASAALGGMLSGAVGGLAADLAAGGLTLGGGMIVGAILGALGGTGLAKGINLARGEDGSSVRWSADFLERLTVTALLRYLAVAHFGRGRGEWSEGEHPPFWQPVVEEAVASQKDDLIRMLKSVPVGSVPVARQVSELSSLLAEAGSAILERLYPLAMRVRSA